MIIGIDIGGTKTLVAVFDDSMNLVQKMKFATPTDDYAEFLTTLEHTANELSFDQPAKGAIGIRGGVDRENGMFTGDGIIQWGNASLASDAQRIFGCGFRLENDSKLAGLAEARLRPNDYQKIVYLTVSTGIGSTFVVDSALDPYTVNSEVGKWYFEKDGVAATWESFASGKAIVERFHKLASEIEDEPSLREIAKNLAPGIVNIFLAYTPNLLIIGGGVGLNYDKFSPYLDEYIHELTAQLPDHIQQCPIIKANHPEEAVVYGCYFYAND